MFEPSSSPVATIPRRARGAVTVLFFVNGALIANWFPRIPQVKAELGLGEGSLGAALLGIGLGGFIGSLAAGPMVAKLGSRRASVWSGVVLGGLLFLPGIAGSWAALIGTLTLIGAADGAMDVAMNAHAVSVQHRYPRPILNAFHGWWGLGAASGAVAGSIAAGAGINVALHLSVAGLILAAVTIAVSRWLLATDTDRQTAGGPSFVMPGRAILVLGVLTMLAAFIEDTPAVWSAVYLRQELDVSAGLAGGGYAAAAIMLTAGRLVADRVLSLVGVTMLARAGLILAAFGLGVALIVNTPIAVIVGFGLVGLGVAPLFPAAFGAAGALRGYPPGAAISIVSLIARFGFLFGPLLIGMTAEQFTLRTGLWLPVLAALLGLTLTARLSTDDT